MKPAEAQMLERLRQNMNCGPIPGRVISEITGLSQKALKVHAVHLRAAIHQSRLVLESEPGKLGGYWLRWLPERG